MPPLQITVVVSDRVGDLVKGRNTAGQSHLLRAKESVLRTFSMTLRAPPLFCRSAYHGTTFIAGELISYAVDCSGDPGSCHLSRGRVGCPVRAACTKRGRTLGGANRIEGVALYCYLNPHTTTTYRLHIRKSSCHEMGKRQEEDNRVFGFSQPSTTAP